MSQKIFEHQLSLIHTHQAKCDQALEYQKWDDARVHLMIANVLTQGLEARWEYEKEALLKTARQLS